MLATGHPDARVRIWDTRAKGETLTKASLSSHKQWISDVAWAPGSETMVSFTFALAGRGDDAIAAKPPQKVLGT